VYFLKILGDGFGPLVLHSPFVGGFGFGFGGFGFFLASTRTNATNKSSRIVPHLILRQVDVK